MLVRVTLGRLSHCAKTAKTSSAAMKFWLSRTDRARLLARARWACGEITSAAPTRLRFRSPPLSSGAGLEGPG
eukprot:6121183-Prorocentrum_lima.AAC.1